MAWARDLVLIDPIVPERVNDQETVPLTATRLPVIELPDVQALARAERVAVELHDGRTGPIRVPDLLGAATLKCTTALTDRRDPDHHPNGNQVGSVPSGRKASKPRQNACLENKILNSLTSS